MRKILDLRISEYWIDSENYPDGQLKAYNSLDLFDSEEIKITIQQQDVNDYNKQKISYSRTFNIPATPKNIKLFKWNNLLMSTLDLNSGQINNLFEVRIPCELWLDSLFLFKGTLILIAINRVGNDIQFECTFTTTITAIIPLLNEVPFNDEYIIDSQVILEKNWIWDSILFDNYIPNVDSKLQLFPITSTASHYPIWVDKTSSGFYNLINSSWKSTAKQSKFYWAFIDDGTITYNIGAPQKVDRVNLTIPDATENAISSVGLLTSRGLDYFNNASVAAKGNMLNLFVSLKPHYFVSDVIRKIFRWLEYKLNADLYSLKNLSSETFPNFTDWNGPTYSNVPIQFQFESDLLSNWNATQSLALDNMVLFNPENIDYSNSVITYNFEITSDDYSGSPAVIFGKSNGEVVAPQIDLIKFPIKYYGATSNEGFNWDEFGIFFFAATSSYANISPITETFGLKETLSIDGHTFFSSTSNDTLNPVSGRQRLVRRWFGIGSYSVLPSYITNNLPTGYDSSNYINLKSTAMPNSQPISSKFEEKWKYLFFNYKNYTQAIINVADNQQRAYNPDIFSGFDLRRFIYPKMSGITLGNFLTDIFKSCNIKFEENNFQTPTYDILKLKTSKKFFDDQYAQSGIIDLTNKMSSENLKIKQNIYDSITFKFGEQISNLNDQYKNENKWKLNYGEYKKEFKTLIKSNKSIEIETKLGRPIFKRLVVTQINRDYNRNDFNQIGGENAQWDFLTTNSGNYVLIPSIYDFSDYKKDVIDFNTNIQIKPIASYTPFILFNGASEIGTYKTATVSRVGDFATGYADFTTDFTFRYFHLDSRKTLTGPINGTARGEFQILESRFTNNNLIIDLMADSSTSTAILSLTNSNAIAENSYDIMPQWQFDLNDINNQRVIELELDLSLTDILKFSFSQPYSIRIGGELNFYRINKIIDWNASRNLSTKVELVQLNNYSDFIK